MNWPQIFEKVSGRSCDDQLREDVHGAKRLSALKR
jgi:hypothetical protein